MKRIPPKWAVRKRDGRWRVYDSGTWYATYDSLQDAHSDATCNAVADVLYAPGGLTLLAQLKTDADRAAL